MSTGCHTGVPLRADSAPPPSFTHSTHTDREVTKTTMPHAPSKLTLKTRKSSRNPLPRDITAGLFSGMIHGHEISGRERHGPSHSPGPRATARAWHVVLCG